jgi:hypothetical protein
MWNFPFVIFANDVFGTVKFLYFFILTRSLRSDRDNSWMSLIWNILRFLNRRMDYWKSAIRYLTYIIWQFITCIPISKILPSRRFISCVITLSQCPITIPDCRLNSRIPRFIWPLFQSYDALDKSTTRQDFRYIGDYAYVWYFLAMFAKISYLSIIFDMILANCSQKMYIFVDFYD